MKEAFVKKSVPEDRKECANLNCRDCIFDCNDHSESMFLPRGTLLTSLDLEQIGCWWEADTIRLCSRCKDLKKDCEQKDTEMILYRKVIE